MLPNVRILEVKRVPDVTFITTHRACRVLRTVFVALALTGSGAMAADDGGRVGGTGADATGVSSKQDRPAASWFNLNALDLNVYGLSYHPDREAVRREHLDNEFNPGLGFNYELASDARGITFAQVGAYHDSGKNWAKFAGVGYQFKFAEHWRIGGAIVGFNSRTYNDGEPFIGAVPLLTYDLGRIKLNAIYLPKAGENKIDAFGFYVSIPLGQWAR